MNVQKGDLAIVMAQSNANIGRIVIVKDMYGIIAGKGFCWYVESTTNNFSPRTKNIIQTGIISDHFLRKIKGSEIDEYEVARYDAGINKMSVKVTYKNGVGK